ncbi:MAG: hypothetical protein K2N06_05565 [Oscillospiraceae bacterium]|nr:hypothetical protein [Oscillospiraceae bacterium]
MKNVINTNFEKFDTVETRARFFRTANFEVGKTYTNGVDTIKVTEGEKAINFVVIVDGKEIYDVWQDGFEFYFEQPNYVLAAAGFVEV